MVYGDCHDALTGLPNRVLFLKQLQRAIAHSRNSHRSNAITVLSLDLDRFKLINENFGHRMGDQFLIETASRVHACLPANSQLARVGGDEFAILLNQLSDSDKATKIANRLQQALASPVHLNETRDSEQQSVWELCFIRKGMSFSQKICCETPKRLCIGLRIWGNLVKRYSQPA